MSNLNKALEYLERNLDLEHISMVKKKMKDIIAYRSDESAIAIFTPEIAEDFINVPLTDIHESMELMLYNELAACCQGTLIKDDRVYSIRANYGVGTLASLFGAKTIFADKNSMPWCEHLKDKKEVEKIISDGVPSLDNGFGKKIIDTYEFYAEQLSKYKTVKEGVRLYHPDLQGPLDVAHLIYGTEIYIDMYDDPEFVHSLLSVVTDTYIQYMKKIKPYLNDTEDGFCFHWNTLYPGDIVLRNDTAVNISTDMYNEFVRPYDEKIIKEFGKASIHYCGQRKSWLNDMLLKTEGLAGINFGRVPNLEYNEDFLKEVLDIASTKQIGVISFNVDKEDLIDLLSKNYRKGISYFTNVNSIQEAKDLISQIK